MKFTKYAYLISAIALIIFSGCTHSPEEPKPADPIIIPSPIGVYSAYHIGYTKRKGDNHVSTYDTTITVNIFHNSEIGKDYISNLFGRTDSLAINVMTNGDFTCNLAFDGIDVCTPSRLIKNSTGFTLQQQVKCDEIDGLFNVTLQKQ